MNDNLHRMQLLQSLLATMHDSNANIVKFKSTFNGDCNDTIRFVFAIQGYDEITNFQDPNSLFLNIYNVLPHHIQVEFGADKSRVLDAQQNALNNNSTEDEIAEAAIYSIDSMQEFFVRSYRPTIQRSQIFRHLHSLYMRRNENPRAVIDRMIAAIQYAKTTIDLLNRTNTDHNNDMATITDGDVTELMSRLFCSTHSNTTNPGQINILVQKKFRADKPRYDHANGAFTPFYTIADNVVVDLGTMWYAKDHNYKIQHYDPLPLPLWETPRPKSKITTTKPVASKAPTSFPSRKRQRFNPSRYSSSQPPHKRQRYNQQQYNPRNRSHQRHAPKPQYPRSNPIICYRCGKANHSSKQCHSRHEINSDPLQPNDRRIPTQWPFRSQSRIQSHTRSHQFTTKHRQPQQSWRQYQSKSVGPQHQQPKSQNQRQTQPQNANSNSTQLLSMITNLRDKASEDTHIDPQILVAIDELRDTITSPNDPQPRQ